MRSNDTALVETDVPLAPLTTLGVGGPARHLARVRSRAALADAFAWAQERGLETYVLGGGSNVVVADAGVAGVVICPLLEGRRVEPGEDGDVILRAGAGEVWDAVVADATARGLTGLECLSGIPGLVGATPIQNVGAYGQEVGAVIASVTAFDARQRTEIVLTPEACGFGYRSSRFTTPPLAGLVICDVAFRLRRGRPELSYAELRDEVSSMGDIDAGPAAVREAVLALRRRKGMVVRPEDPDTRSVGSFFVNPVVPALDVTAWERRSLGRAPRHPQADGRVKVPAAWLIEMAGFPKGFATGSVGLSSKHALAIVNRGGATAAEVLALAVAIKRSVVDRFGVALVPEPRFVGFGPDADVRYLQERGI